MKKSIIYLSIIFSAFFLFLIFFLFALNVHSQTPTGKLTRIRFVLLESSLEPEKAEILKRQVFAPDPSATLKPFFDGKIEATGMQEIENVVKSRFSLDYTRIKKQGVFLLTWREKMEPGEKEMRAREGLGMQITPQQQGFFYDGSEIFSHANTTFFTLDGKRHRLSLKAPVPSIPPGAWVEIKIFESQSLPDKEPPLDEPEPSVFEFSDLVELPESGGQLVAMLGPQDTAYFLFFIAESILKDYDVESLLPRLIHKVDPIYPEELRFRKIQGKVVLVVRTDADGRVHQIQVSESSHPLLSEAAAQAVKQWVYKVPDLDGKKIPVVFTVTVTFRV
jgi:TonB family protein